MILIDNEETRPMVLAELKDAISLHKENRLDEAFREYCKVIATNPQDITALNGLSIVCGQTNRLSDGIKHAKQLVALSRRPEHHNTLGNLLKKSQSCDFMIYEKEDGLRFNEGYGIQLSTNSISILNEIDFDNIDEKQVFNPNKINFFSIKNKKICELDLNVFNRPDVKYTTLRRSTLVEFLKEKIYKNNLKFNKVVKKISELKGNMLINFEDKFLH